MRPPRAELVRHPKVSKTYIRAGICTAYICTLIPLTGCTAILTRAKHPACTHSTRARAQQAPTPKHQPQQGPLAANEDAPPPSSIAFGARRGGVRPSPGVDWRAGWQDGQMVTPPGAGNAWVWGMQNATMLQYFSTTVPMWQGGTYPSWNMARFGPDSSAGIGCRTQMPALDQRSEFTDASFVCAKYGFGFWVSRCFQTSKRAITKG